jgi:hypothetical protein
LSARQSSIMLGVMERDSASGDRIIRIDDITLVPGGQARFLERLQSDYVSAARARGLELVEVALAPPTEAPDRETGVVLTWHLPDVDAFWTARRAALTDPAVAAFWAATADLVATRTRRYATAAVTATPVDDSGAAPRPSDGVHHLVLLSLPPDHEWSVAEPPTVRRSRFGRHLPGSVGSVDASWELVADHELTVTDLGVPDGLVDDVVVLGAVLGAGIRAPGLTGGIKRTLLLRVDDGAAEAVVRAFERDLLAMPRHISAIRNWRLSHVAGSGAGWTHAWEQEYETLAGLRDDYMRSAFHWGVVDGWFDPEDPRCIVAPRVLHLFYEIATTALAAPTS